MTDLKAQFDECFKREFPATYEAALRGEPKPHGDFSNAWWGFRGGYRCALPTTEPKKPRGSRSWSLLIVLWSCAAFYIGYQFPRDLELESTKPIALHYEITPEALRRGVP